ETYQYKILRDLAREIEDKITLKEKNEFTENVIHYKNNLDEISKLVGDGDKRALRVNELLINENGSTVDKSLSSDVSSGHISKNKLKEIKEALDEGLISAEEYEKAKKEFLKL